MSASTDLPALDCHAHIAPDVTPAQLTALGDVHVFAVTRSLAEAVFVASRHDRNITWGAGVHPGIPRSISAYSPELFRQVLPRFAYIGEVGLDRRGDRAEQERVLNDILAACRDRPLLISLHSTGRTGEVVSLIERHRHPGTILHWFLGSPSQMTRALHAGAYFSANNAMSDETLLAIPRDRLLPETDFPARRVRADRPGATLSLEQTLARLWDSSAAHVRWQLWTNLRTIAVESGAIDAISEELADRLLAL